MRTYKCLTALLAISILTSCAITGTGVDSALNGSGPVAENGDVAQASGRMPPQSVTIFPHLPVPMEMEKIASETVVFTTPEFHGGIFTLKGSLSPESVADFFQKRLPQEGWRLAGRLESEKCYMAFKNSTGGSMLMQITSSDMGFKTEVKIFVSQGYGGENATP